MTWTIDAVHSRIGFAVKHMMVSTVRGEFRSYRAGIELDPADFTRSRFEASIDVASVETGNAQRDADLRTGAFFDASNHPTMEFRSSRIERRGEAFAVHGDLTIRGVTRPVVLDVTYLGDTRGPDGRQVAGLEVRGTIDRRDFGMAFHAVLETGAVVVANEVRIEIDVEAVAGEVAAAA